ncbi:MAG: hypothetical protein A2091_03780 [Desulfuromonadales bacterium GWD2_61_12]|nr:MAG: hypothetical protein A2005_09105 [Desulfuromonadales bacterium GWC2_61_20]OGR36123.1 MAG: hypothetical protein A2091_03780 [Desulfuromonadales bacterium GWD2_61_12]HAD04885.1 hypothetical protein [Desulfuromonas sp.]HBT83644.1 hypothetical protein [Desulfuromonas sp.]
MKQITLLLLVLSGLLVLAASVGAYFAMTNGGPRQEALYVSAKITCGACAGNLQQALEPLAGVKAVSVEVVRQEVRVGYDPQRLDPERIALALNAAGYPARLVALGTTSTAAGKSAGGGCGGGCCPPR